MDPGEREEILGRLRRDAAAIAAAFGLEYAAILPARADARSFYGLCDSEGRIRIRLNHVATGRALRYSSLVNTLCHELAHLRYLHHGPAFQAFHRRILEWARARGLYRPGGAEMTEVACRAPVSRAALRDRLARLRAALDASPGAAALPGPLRAAARAGSVSVQMRLFDD